MGINDKKYCPGDIGVHILAGGAMLTCLGIEDQDGAGQYLGDIVLVIQHLCDTSQVQGLGDAVSLIDELLQRGHRLTSIELSC